jgi:hypothetical protein
MEMDVALSGKTVVILHNINKLFEVCKYKTRFNRNVSWNRSWVGEPPFG